MSIIDLTLKATVNGLFKVEKENFQRINFSGKTIIMPNHLSLADAAVLAFNLPKEVVFVANTGAAKRYSFIHKFRKIITLDTMNPSSIREVIDLVNNGTPVVIFPEGRITTTGATMKIYEGVGFIALKTGATIYPVSINGLERSKWGYTNHLWKTTYFPKTRMTVGNPFHISVDEKDSGSIQREKAAKQISKVLINELANSRFKVNVNLFNELLDSAKLNGYDKEIIEDITGEMTYKDFILASYVFGIKLKELLKGQNRVGLFLPNSNGHAIALYGLFYSGITPAILNFSAGEKAVVEAIETVDLKTIITSRQFVEKGGFEDQIKKFAENANILYMEDIKESISSADKRKGFSLYVNKKRSAFTDNEVILFTSGSESRPKGVALSHDNLYANLTQLKTVIAFTGTDKIFNAMPMFHSFGLTAGTILPLTLGVGTFLYPRPLDFKSIPELVYSSNSTVLFGTSTFLEGFAKYAHPYDFFNLRYVVAGAERLREEVRDLWLDKFGVRILEGYGATETAPVLSVNTPLEYKKGTVGKLLPGLEFKIEPVEGLSEGGKLFVKGPNVMKGYYIYGKGFLPHTEWYDTGDVVDIDADGFITIKARLKRFAKVAGEMVSLNFVEEIASRCFGSTQFFSVAVSDKKKGETIVLFTTEDVADLKELKKYVKEHKISPLNLPSRIEILTEIPKLGGGKPNYLEMKDIADALVNNKVGFFNGLLKKLFRKE